MIKFYIRIIAVIFVLFSQSSCNKKIASVANDKPETTIDDVKGETKRIKSQKIMEGFKSIALPGGSSSILLLRLGQASDGSYWSVVKFPKGYQRPDSFYLNAEEGYLVIEGMLKYSGITSPTWSYTVIPPEVARTGTYTDVETVAIARFSDKPVWVEKPKQKSNKAIKVNLLDTEINIESPTENRVSTVYKGNLTVEYFSDIAQIKNFKGGVIYSLTDSVIVEILEGEPFPKLNKPFIIWSKKP